MIHSAAAFIAHLCLERSPKQTFGEGDEKQRHKQEATGGNVCLAGRVCSRPAESVGISARLPDCVSSWLVFFLHSSQGKNGCFPFEKDESEKRQLPHRCQSQFFQSAGF